MSARNLFTYRIRLLRREWRQQLLILALITVAVAATVVAATVATNTPFPGRYAGGRVPLSGSPAAVKLENRWGRVDVMSQIPVHGPIVGPGCATVQRCESWRA